MRLNFKGAMILGGLTALLLLAARAPFPLSPPAPPPPVAASERAGGTAAAKVVGDANAGKTLFAAKGCVACHVAQGVPGAVGTIGPNLNGLGDAAKHPQLASGDPNTPVNIRGWIKDPQTKKPGTQMPNLNLTDKESDDLTAFLVTLR